MTRRPARAAAPVVAVLAVALGLLTGCSGDDEPEAASSTATGGTVATSPSVTPGTPTASAGSPTSASASTDPTPTVTVAGQSAKDRYLTLVAPYNAAFFAANTEAERPSPDLEAVRAESAKAAAALVRFVADLRATRWPADVEPAATALARSAEADIPGWQASARARTMQEWRAVRFPPEDGASARMREVLGLPPVPQG